MDRTLKQQIIQKMLEKTCAQFHVRFRKLSQQNEFQLQFFSKRSFSVQLTKFLTIKNFIRIDARCSWNTALLTLSRVLKKLPFISVLRIKTWLRNVLLCNDGELRTRSVISDERPGRRSQKESARMQTHFVQFLFSRINQKPINCTSQRTKDSRTFGEGRQKGWLHHKRSRGSRMFDATLKIVSSNWDLRSLCNNNIKKTRKYDNKPVTLYPQNFPS